MFTLYWLWLHVTCHMCRSEGTRSEAVQWKTFNKQCERHYRPYRHRCQANHHAPVNMCIPSPASCPSGPNDHTDACLKFRPIHIIHLSSSAERTSNMRGFQARRQLWNRSPAKKMKQLGTLLIYWKQTQLGLVDYYPRSLLPRRFQHASYGSQRKQVETNRDKLSTAQQKAESRCVNGVRAKISTAR